MIEKIDIGNFGSYSQFKHDSNIDSVYKKLNVFYGKNYSGKSTFSKIIQSFERNELPAHYEDIQFKITTDDITNKTLTEKNVNSHNLKVKVFNAQYIHKNLNFFSNEGINTFTLLGEQNLENQKEINELNKIKSEIQNNDVKKKDDFTILEEELRKKEKYLHSKKVKIATEIRQDNNLFIGHYDIRNLNEEIEKEKIVGIHNKSILSPEVINEYKKKIKEEEKKSFPKIIFPNINYQELLNETNGIIKETIIPSVIIKEFQDNPQKQQWAKNGMELHKETDICSFCGNELTNNRYEELDNFFSDSVTILEKKILKFKEKLVNEKEKLLSLEPLSEKDFYIEYQRNIKELNYNIQQEKTIGILFIEKLITVIDKKSNSLFQKIEEIEEDLPNGFYLETEGINDIYKKIYLKNNQSAQNLDEKKDECRKELRKDVINDKLSQIEYEDNNYYDLNQRIDVLKEQLVEEKKILQESDEKIETLSKKIEKLGKNQKNEKNAANQINTYLNNRLGQDELHLDINKDKNNQYSFAIFRQGNPAYNLSEGEMTLISFAYYLASLKTLSEDERKKVIIVIDDPISSLDENNIFYIYSLISGEIISKDSDQIFITTHNLDFLKYVMRYKINAKQTKYLIINKSKEENGNWRSSITQMPKYMSSKVTEFNFLFEQIYTVAKDDINDKNYNVYYNFPNNARKFLEALLFFKYPSYIDEKNDSLWRFKKFFGEGIEETFINRINNEYSHGMDRFDRVSQKLNSSEFSKDATLILRTIKSKDYDQYESFLNNSKLSDCNWN